MTEPDLKLSWQVQEPTSFEELVGYLIHYASPFSGDAAAQEYGVITSVNTDSNPEYKDKILLWGYWGGGAETAVLRYDRHVVNRITLYVPSFWPVPLTDFDKIKVIKKVITSSLKLAWQTQEPLQEHDRVKYIGDIEKVLNSQFPSSSADRPAMIERRKDLEFVLKNSMGEIISVHPYGTDDMLQVRFDTPDGNYILYGPETDFELIRRPSFSELKLGWQVLDLYEGKYKEGPTFGFAYIVYKDGKQFSYVPSLAVENHSPTGFAWGYGGSGPCQLALAILYDYTKDKEFSRKWQYEFKNDFVAKWPANGDWQLSGDEIDNWINEKTIQKESWIVRKTLSKGELRDLITSVGLTPISFYITKRTRKVIVGYLVNNKWEDIPDAILEKLRSGLSSLSPEGVVEVPEEKYYITLPDTKGVRKQVAIIKVPVYRDTPNVPWREIRKQLSAIGYDKVDIKTSTTEIRVDVWGIDDLTRHRRMEEVNKVLTILKQFNPNFKAYQSRLPGYYFYSAPIKMQEYPDETTASLEKESWAMTKNISKGELEEAITSAGLTLFRTYIGRTQRKAVACYRPSGRYENIPRSAITALRENLSAYEGTIIEFPITSPFFQYVGPSNIPERAKKFLAVFVPIKRDRQLLPIKEVKNAVREKFPQYEVRVFTRTNEIELSIDTPWELEGRSENLRGQAKQTRYQELLDILKQFNTNTIISPSENWRRNESGYHFLIPFSPYQEYITGV